MTIVSKQKKAEILVVDDQPLVRQIDRDILQIVGARPPNTD